MKKAWSVALDGQVYASPLVAEHIVVVATENNSLFGFTRGGTLLWGHHDVAPVPLSQLPCGNIDPLGITGTPVYDLASHRVYAEREENDPRDQQHRRADHQQADPAEQVGRRADHHP